MRAWLPIFLAGLMPLAASGQENIPSEAGLDAALNYSAAHNGLSLLVIQHGRTLLEQYAPGNGPNIRHRIYSGTKGLWCVAAVAAQTDGILNLDEPVAATIPQWRDDPARRQITIRELLNFTAGIDPGFHLHSDAVTDRDGYALALPQVARPGGSFIYGPGQIQVFCEVLRRKLASRDETPWQYLERRVLRPLGLRSIPHKMDSRENPLMATGIQLTPREWSRFGELLLDGGGKVVPSNALGQCLCGTARNPAFGMGFWLNREAPGGRVVNVEDNLEPKWWRENWSDACLCPQAPRDLFVSLGSMGQRLYVIPSLDLIVVRLSEDSNFSDARFLDLLLGRS
ncbi:MAG TPA: serine hydrolase [Chthoniobacteraceae bacterium]|jgi:CubicO group peptidase (beta-lactamase class C family)|nr:serine hydrolase [Chthoniobacteraceae bacterium]